MIRPLSAATFITFTVALLAAGGAMAQIAPEPEQIEELLKGPAEGPVVMVNLLRFKKEADAPDEGLSRARRPTAGMAPRWSSGSPRRAPV